MSENHVTKKDISQLKLSGTISTEPGLKDSLMVSNKYLKELRDQGVNLDDNETLDEDEEPEPDFFDHGPGM